MYDKRKIDTAIHSIRLYESDEVLAYRKKNGYRDQGGASNFNRNFRQAEYIMAYGEMRINRYYAENEFRPCYSFLLFKVISFTPAKVEYPFLGMPRLVAPSLVVQDQSGKTFELLEVHRSTFNNDSLALDAMLDETGANGVCVTPCDRLFKLTDANNIVPECIRYSNSSGVRLKPLTRYEASQNLRQWNAEKGKIAREIRADYDRVQKLYRELQERNKKNADEAKRKLADLDNMFK